MPRPIHFEIHAENIPRCQAFYEALFGWSFTALDMGGGMTYHLIKTGDDGPGIDGGLMRRIGANPPPLEATPVIAYVCTVGVDDLDATVDKAVSLGGMVALPKMPVPGTGWLAYVKDCESNILGLMQMDGSA